MLGKTKQILGWEHYDYYALVLVSMATRGAIKTWKDLDFPQKYDHKKLVSLDKRMKSKELSKYAAHSIAGDLKNLVDFQELYKKICKETYTQALFSIRNFFKNEN